MIQYHDAGYFRENGKLTASHLDTGSVPLVLIAPAWKKWGTATKVKAGTVIVHSQDDDVVSIEDSRELLHRSGLPPTLLEVAGEDHRMVDAGAFAALLKATENAAAVSARASISDPNRRRSPR